MTLRNYAGAKPPTSLWVGDLDKTLTVRQILAIVERLVPGLNDLPVYVGGDVTCENCDEETYAEFDVYPEYDYPDVQSFEQAILEELR